MSYQTQKVAIESRFNTQWAGRTPVRYPNSRFTPTDGTTFVDFEVVGGHPSRSLGEDPIFRDYGSIAIKIHIPKGVGSGQAYTLADQAAAIFRDAQFSSITCYAPRPPVAVGVNEEWYVVAVTIPFHWDGTY
jgi:hypothetical protein